MSHPSDKDTVFAPPVADDPIDRQFALVDLALKITFFLVGPVPVFVLTIGICATIEVLVELVFWNSSYYQDHRWCPFVGCLLAGVASFALRHVRYMGAGLWIGPCVVALGLYGLLH